MKDSKTIIKQIEVLEKEGQRKKAQSVREKLLQKAESANDGEFLFIIDTLIKEKPTIGAVEEAGKVEPYCRHLHDVVEKRIGRTHALVALAKRQLARIFAIQGRYQEAISIVENALPILAAQFGDDGYEVREAIDLTPLVGHFITEVLPVCCSFGFYSSRCWTEGGRRPTGVR